MDAVAGKNIYQRLHAVMGEIDYVQKEKKAGMQYSIVSHDRVTALVRPELHKQGVVYHISGLDHAQDGNRTTALVKVRFVNIDDPRDFVESISFGYGVDPGDKGPGKAMSYAVKYALLKTLGLETGDDPDEVQDERANHQPDERLPRAARGVSPHDLQKEPGQLSSNASLRQWKILEEGLKKQATPAEINRWFHSVEAQVGEMHEDWSWKFFYLVLQTGLDKCQQKIAVDLFWSFHEKRLNKLRKFDRVKYDELQEYMMTKAAKLGGELINAG